MWKTGTHKKVDNFQQTIIDLVTSSKNNLKVVVGCDSQVIGSRISFVTVVIFLDKGKGRFLYNKQFAKNQGSLKYMQNRLFEQATKSINLAKRVDRILQQFNMHVSEVHCDVNPSKKYKSSRIASACVGYINGNGYQAVIKPYSYAASKVSDSLTR